MFTLDIIARQLTLDISKHFKLDNIKVYSFLKSVNYTRSLQKSFRECILGYHLVNDVPISEKVWEQVNEIVFKNANIQIYTKSSSSHKSGMDIDTSIGKISNKSSKYIKNNFTISSYRLTNICSENNINTMDKIIEEISTRNNFDYYSIVVRDEKDVLKYDWYLIPSNIEFLNPHFYTWTPLIGKKGNKKGLQIGWTTLEKDSCKMSIYFCMSSQLWIYIGSNCSIKKYLIATVKTVNKPLYNYIDLYNKLN